MLGQIAVCMVLAGLSQPIDTLSGSLIESSFKLEGTRDDTPHFISSVRLASIETGGITSPKDLSAVVPGLYVPDYGSAMTSSIYMRGFGSRIGDPSVALYIDDVPVVDKDNYDFLFADIRAVDVLSGPQGTLFGRNSLSGLISVRTLSPENYQGARFSAEYGSLASYALKASVYRKSLGVTLAFRRDGGFYTNEYDGSDADASNSAVFRVRYAGMAGRAAIDNTFSFSHTCQGGYPYRRWLEDGILMPVMYNDPCEYRRVSLTDGLKATLLAGKFEFVSVSGIQLLYDKLRLDNDFTPESMFTLQQIQNQAALTQEIVLRPLSDSGIWKWQTGAFALVKYNGVSAPVRFLEDGISSLIEDNANSAIPEEIGRLDIAETAFPISSDFDIMAYNAALFHESVFSLSRWRLTVGLRADYERNVMGYDSRADFSFIVSPFMKDYLPYHEKYVGRLKGGHFTLLPRFSASYSLCSSERGNAIIFGTVSRGFRSGGFNTQIFSDILQNRMTVGMMRKLGVTPDWTGDIDAAKTEYKPEVSMNFEIGGRGKIITGRHRIEASLSAYLVTCRNQQITVFPYDKGTGRMMANAGSSRSMGIEASALWKRGPFIFSAGGSLLDAVFVSYNDGRYDYSGNRIPYTPSSKAYVRAEYAFRISSRVVREVVLDADMNMIGDIVWNEAGNISQNPYCLLGAGIRVKLPKSELYANCLNIADQNYSTFYFKSVGNSFFQTGKPRRFNVGIRVEL